MRCIYHLSDFLKRKISVTEDNGTFIKGTRIPIAESWE